VFSITIEAFMIAGGLVIGKLGFNMLNAKPRQTEKEEKESKKRQDISIIPLAIPLLSGPGAITTALVWTSQAPGTPEKIGLLLIPVVISLLAYPIIINAKLLERFFGHTGINVIEKLMGLIVLVMGVQFIINALVKLIPTIV
ncbi:MAG: MarC family protein, partial [archaeon]